LVLALSLLFVPFASNGALAVESMPKGPRALAGVSIDENAKGALARLGLAPPRSAPAGGIPAGAKRVAEYRVFLADMGRALVGLSFDSRIRVIVVHPNGTHSSSITDPFGVRLGDSRQELSAKRGRPDSISHGEHVYGEQHGLHWFYSIEGGRVKAIGVSDEK
jgi:hypothetical protein